MRLQSCSNPISRSLILLSIMSGSVYAQNQTGKIAVDVSSGVYNGKNQLGETSEDFSGYLRIGPQIYFSDRISTTLSTYLSSESEDDSYFGLTFDYTQPISQRFDVYARLGGDLIGGEFAPKTSLGIQAEITPEISLMMESVLRDSDEFSEYQYEMGIKYKFGAETSDKVAVEDDKSTAPPMPALPILGTCGPLPTPLKMQEELKARQDPKDSPSKTLNYTIKKGDTLWQISEENKMPLHELEEKNKDVISNPHWVYPGQVIQL